MSAPGQGAPPSVSLQVLLQARPSLLSGACTVHSAHLVPRTTALLPPWHREGELIFLECLGIALGLWGTVCSEMNEQGCIFLCAGAGVVKPRHQSQSRNKNSLVWIL